jgi:hypothetical protein
MTERQDQTEGQIIEESGITDGKERRLTLEAEKLIREFMIKWVSLPAIFLAVISFIIGFFINRIAFQTASSQAFLSAQSEVMRLIREVGDAKFKADAAAEAIQSSSKEMKQSEQKAKKFEEDLSSLRNKLDSTVAFQASNVQIKQIADVLARDPRIVKILDDLDTSIQERLKKAGNEIEELKSAYRIDCLEGNFQGGSFTFSFPVKRAWVEPAQIDEAHRLIVTKIEGNSVTVIPVTARILRGPERSMYEKRKRDGELASEFRVWATSF